MITDYHGEDGRSRGVGAQDKDSLVPKEGWQEARAKPLHSLPAVPECQAVWGGGILFLEAPPLRPIALTPIPYVYTRPSAKSLPQQLSACLEPSSLCKCRSRHLPTGAPTPTRNQQKPSHINHNCPPHPYKRTTSPPPQPPPIMTEPYVFTVSVSIECITNSLRSPTEIRKGRRETEARS